MQSEDPHETTARVLNELADKMLLRGRDQEAAHAQADELLLSAIYTLAAPRTKEINEAADRLCQMFRGLPKWYA